MARLGTRKTMVSLPLRFNIDLGAVTTALSVIRASSDLASLIGYINGDAYEAEDVAAAVVDVIALCPNLIEFYSCLPTIASFHALLDQLHPRGLLRLRRLRLSCWSTAAGYQEIPVDEMFKLLRLLPTLQYCVWQSSITNYERLPVTLEGLPRIPERLDVHDLRAKAAIHIFSMFNSNIRTSRINTVPEDMEFLRTIDWNHVSLPLTTLRLSLLSCSADDAVHDDPKIYSCVLSACPRVRELWITIHSSNINSINILRAMLSVTQCHLRTLIIHLDMDVTSIGEDQRPAEHPFPAVVDLLCQVPPAISALRLLEIGVFVMRPELERARDKMLECCRARYIRCTTVFLTE